LNKLYRKSEIGFSIFWIIAYIVGSSMADQVSESIGITKSVTFAVHLIMSVVTFVWIRKNHLQREYGLCRPEAPASKFLYYIPLVMLVSCNVWFGLTWNMSVWESLFYMGSMVCVGFLEELIFRGFLFKAMSKDNVTAAIMVSSLTFGIGHIINLLNGAQFLPTLLQIIYATAAGFLFTIIFLRAADSRRGNENSVRGYVSSQNISISIVYLSAIGAYRRFGSHLIYDVRLIFIEAECLYDQNS